MWRLWSGQLASYPQWDGKRVVAHGLRGEGLVHWLGWWYVCVLHRGSSCSPSRAMDGRLMRHGIISSCQSAATSETVKRCCSNLVSSAITSTQTFTFYLFTQELEYPCLNLCTPQPPNVIKLWLKVMTDHLHAWKDNQYNNENIYWSIRKIFRGISVDFQKLHKLKPG